MLNIAQKFELGFLSKETVKKLQQKADNMNNKQICFQFSILLTCKLGQKMIKNIFINLSQVCLCSKQKR
jgi:hypothetical protein